MRGKLLLIIIILGVSVTPVYATTKFELDLAKGIIPGHSVWHKFGENLQVQGNTHELIWSGGNITYPYLTTARVLSLSSSDINDDVGDTGLWNVTVFGLDQNWVLANETIQLDGQNGVNTTTTWIRVFRLQGRNAGASQMNEGKIYCGYGVIGAGVPDNILAVIDDELSQSQMALITIPINTTGYITSFYYTLDTDKLAVFELQIRVLGEIFTVKNEVTLKNQIWRSTPDFVPLRVEGQSDIQMIVEDAKLAAVSGGFTIIFVEDGFNVVVDDAQSTNNGLMYLLIALIIFALIAWGSKK